MKVHFQRRNFISRIALWAPVALLLAGGLAHAQTWPTKAVRIVVPVGAGGTTDILARAMSQALQQATGQPFIVDLKPGANGAIGSLEVARAPADGYTLLVGTVSTHGVGPATLTSLGYGPADFTPIALLADTPSLMVVSPKLGVKSVKQFIELARAKPGYINYTSTGPGAYTHLVSEMFALQSGIKMTHVPYKGFAQMVPDMMAGIVHLTWDAVPSALPYVRDGRLLGLAVTGPKRVAAAPEIPTIGEALAEMGLPGFAVTAWFGLYAPRGLAPELTKRINDEVNKALRSPEIVTRFAAMGIEPAQTTSAEFEAMVNADIERWRRVVREAKIKIE